jgi:hypothetical protein
LIACPRGCGERVSVDVDAMALHLADSCTLHKVVCDYCALSHTQSSLESHQVSSITLLTFIQSRSHLYSIITRLLLICKSRLWSHIK